MYKDQEPELNYVFWYDQISKCGRHTRHCNSGVLRCRRPHFTWKWRALELLQKRCVESTPWLVTVIGAMPRENYEQARFAPQDPPVFMKTYEHP